MHRLRPVHRCLRRGDGRGSARPPHLIAYDSERNQELRAAGETGRLPASSGRARSSTSPMIAMRRPDHAGGPAGCAPRSTSIILPDRNPLYVTLADGSIRNGYVIRVMNKEHAAKDYC